MVVRAQESALGKSRLAPGNASEHLASVAEFFYEHDVDGVGNGERIGRRGRPHCLKIPIAVSLGIPSYASALGGE